MSNITFISSFHSENGNFTADELLKIILAINPEFTFEQLHESLIYRVYNENLLPDEPLEVKCIKHLIPNHIRHIPVDIDPGTGLSNDEIEYLFNIFKKSNTYQQVDNKQMHFTEQYGFAYLNSESRSRSFNRKKIMEQSLLSFGISSAFPIRSFYERFHEEQNNRENAIISKI